MQVLALLDDTEEAFPLGRFLFRRLAALFDFAVVEGRRLLLLSVDAVLDTVLLSGSVDRFIFFKYMAWERERERERG